MNFVSLLVYYFFKNAACIYIILQILNVEKQVRHV